MNASLHHIGILVKDIAEARQAYVDRFGYEIQSEVIHDPIQTACVQFLRGQTEPLVELITPDGPNSKLANALKKGGGLNHLCYLSDLIEEDCRQLRRQGMFLLQEPVAATAFPGRRIAWLMGRDGLPVELVETAPVPCFGPETTATNLSHMTGGR